MSDKPRVFVSAVSSEFGQTRQDVANILTRLGFEPVLQDVFGTEAGDLRQMLREKIDACDGLIQIVGQAYGFEPPSPDEEFGRVSYTQFEYLYARQKWEKAGGKKIWLILTRPGFAGESAADRLDLPSQPDHPDPQGYRAERRALQAHYRERLQKGSDVWYDAADKTELALNVERLKDELAALRKAFRSWQRSVTRYLVAAILLLAVVGGGVSWMLIRLHKDDPVAKALAAFSPELIRAARKVDPGGLRPGRGGGGQASRLERAAESPQGGRAGPRSKAGPARRVPRVVHADDRVGAGLARVSGAVADPAGTGGQRGPGLFVEPGIKLARAGKPIDGDAPTASPPQAGPAFGRGAHAPEPGRSGGGRADVRGGAQGRSRLAQGPRRARQDNDSARRPARSATKV